MAANAAAAPVVATVNRSYHHLEMSKDEKFNGKNYAQFVRDIKLMFRHMDVLYVIDDKAQTKPVGANKEKDNETVFLILHRNVEEMGKELIADHAGDGLTAWLLFKRRFGQSDTGTTIDRLWEHLSARWEGDDIESFNQFMNKWETTRRELRSRDIILDDWIDALILMCMVPREFITKLKDGELRDWKKLKREDVVDRIQAYISARGAEAGAAFLAQQGRNGAKPGGNQLSQQNGRANNGGNNNSNANRPALKPCSICKDQLKLAPDLCKHSEERCFNKDRFATLLAAMKTSPIKLDNAFAALDIEEPNLVSEEHCFIGLHHKLYNALTAIEQETKHSWVIDTGSSGIMTPHAELIIGYTPAPSGHFVKFGNKAALAVKGKGHMVVKVGAGEGSGSPFTLTSVMHVPGLACNLLGVQQFLRKHCQLHMFDDLMTVTTGIPPHEPAPIKPVTLFISQRGRDGLYRITLEPTSGASSQASSSTCLMADAALQHRRFGHVDLSKTKGLDVSLDGVKDCDACIRGKFRRLPFNGTTPEITEPLARVHADLFGPTRIPTLTGARYLCVFVDAATGYTKGYFLKSKDETTQKFIDYAAWVENQTAHKIKRLRTDNGGEFVTTRMEQYCTAQGIEFITNIPYSSKQNGLAERRLGIITQDARTLLLDSGLPAEYWGYAANHAIYLRNRIPRNGEHSPHELLLGRRPRLDHLQPFGCGVYAWLDDTRRDEGKLNARADLCTFLGFEEGTSNCLVESTDSGRFFRGRDTRFVNSVFPNRDDNQHDLTFLDVQWETVGDERQERQDAQPDDPTLLDDDPIIVQQPAPPRPPPQLPVQDSPVASRTRNRRPDPQPTIIHDRPAERSENESSEDEFAFLVYSLDAPRNMTDALNGPDANGWKESLDREMASIAKAETWDLVDESEIPHGMRPIDSRLVLNVKLDPSGGYDHLLKTRLVAKGFTQRPGIDYFETFSPVGHRQSFRIMLTLAASLDLELKGLDISTAFLHGVLEEVVYMRLPKEVDPGNGKVARLKKALYGLKQAGRCWNEELDKWLCNNGWLPIPDDPCVYTHRQANGEIDLLLYVHVDDQAIAGKSETIIDAFIDELEARFPCKRQGALKYFLGMEIHRDRAARRIWVTQHQYIDRMLKRFNLDECRTRKLPMSPSAPETLVDPEPEEVAQAKDLPYREITGSLQYLSTMTRPDITFAVNRMSSFNAGWTAKHFEICKGILRYIAGTRKFGIRLGGPQSGLRGFVDADFNANPKDYKSTTGWLVFLNEGLIGWKSKKQSIQAHSTAESEYMAIDDVSRDLVWERRVLDAMDGSHHITSPTPLNIDNKAAIQLSKNKTSHDSTKHIHYRFHYIRELIKQKQIAPKYIETECNHADILTKALGVDKFYGHARAMGIEAPFTTRQVGESEDGDLGVSRPRVSRTGTEAEPCTDGRVVEVEDDEDEEDVVA